MAARRVAKGPRDGSPAALSEHPLRAGALAEIHARPFPAIASNRVILHLAFSSEGGSTVSHAVMSELSRARGATPPAAGARYHEIGWGRGRLRWESHSEFTTFGWEGPAPARFGGAVAGHPFGDGFSPPGMLISAARIEVRRLTPGSLHLLDRFDQESLAVTVLEDGQSLVATDFRQDGDGMTVFLILEHGLAPARIGYFAKTAIDLETYRTLALLGLPLAHSLSGRLAVIEAELARLTRQMREAEAGAVQSLLASITRLAGELEAEAVASQYRFGATRAYGDIVAERLAMFGTARLPGHKRLHRFLDLRLAPALRTCRSVEQRLDRLSERLSRTANLLRTRVEVEIEEQNRALLDQMNRRARLQLRLQQTVEGLSVAAVSYYVVGLFYYLADAGQAWLPPPLTPKMAAGLFVPVAVLAVWSTVRRIRRHHRDDG